MSAAKTPLRYALVWLLGSFGAFLAVGQVDRVNNLGQLSVAVFAFTAALALGYSLQVRRSPWPTEAAVSRSAEPQVGTIRLLVAVAALHHLAYGVVYMREYGVSDPRAVVQALLNPGGAYLAKFDVFARQDALGSVNTAAQILTIFAVLATPLVPSLIVYWGRLTTDLRILGCICLAVYISFFLAIGTLSGLGSTVIFAGAALLVIVARRTGTDRRRRRGVVAAGVLVGMAFASYMSYNQGARLVETGLTADQRFAPNPVIERLTSRQFAQGVAATSFYPTHGYQGLAYNLETPFEWTHGLGASRALDSYAAQYGVADSVSRDTYPARTEARTGWPAGQYWATVYPWLASDLSWLGIPIFMFFVGWWTSRWWREAVVDGDALALLLFAQAALFIAFIPANNQIGLSRPNLIAASMLIVLYALRQIGRALRRTGPEEPPGRRDVERPLGLPVPAHSPASQPPVGLGGDVSRETA